MCHVGYWRLTLVSSGKALHKRFAGKDNNDPNYQADRLTAKVFTSA